MFTVRCFQSCGDGSIKHRTPPCTSRNSLITRLLIGSRTVSSFVWKRLQSETETSLQARPSHGSPRASSGLLRLPPRGPSLLLRSTNLRECTSGQLTFPGDRDRHDLL